MLGAENKHLGAASQTSLTEVKLRLRRKILFTQNPVLQIFEFNGALRASWVFMLLLCTARLAVLHSNSTTWFQTSRYCRAKVEFNSISWVLHGSSTTFETGLTWTNESSSNRATKIYTVSCSLNFTLFRLFLFLTYTYICLLSFSFFKHLSWLASDRATSV